MFKNYLIISLRNLRRNKLFSFINITGLSICIAVSILLLIWIKDELSYDRFHENADRIYRLAWNKNIQSDELKLATTAFPIGPAITDLYPEIRDYVRILPSQVGVFSYNEKIFMDNRGFLADKSVFDIFSFELIRGNPETALSEPTNVVMTEKTARKYFGEEDPIGKTILSAGKYPIKVTGVLKNIPSNSRIQFDLLVSMLTVTATYDGWSQSWLTEVFTLICLLINTQICELCINIDRNCNKTHKGDKHPESARLGPESN